MIATAEQAPATTDTLAEMSDEEVDQRWVDIVANYSEVKDKIETVSHQLTPAETQELGKLSTEDISMRDLDETVPDNFPRVHEKRSNGLRLAELKQQRGEMLEAWLGDRPAEEIVSEVQFLYHDLYKGRAQERQLDDGGTLITFGSRSKSNMTIQEFYVIHKSSEGKYRYGIVQNTDDDVVFFDINGAGEADIAVRHKSGPQAPSPQVFRSTYSGDEKPLRKQFRGLLEQTLEAASNVMERDNNGVDRAKADDAAKGLVEETAHYRVLSDARGDADIEKFFDSFKQLRPMTERELDAATATVLRGPF